MKTVTATWKNGQVQPDEAGEWPEGCRLMIQPLQEADTIGIPEESWSSSPEAIAAWLEWYASLEPLEFTPEEEAEADAWRLRIKEHAIAKMNESAEGLSKKMEPTWP
jgi:hypothetical protein